MFVHITICQQKILTLQWHHITYYIVQCYRHSNLYLSIVETRWSNAQQIARGTRMEAARMAWTTSTELRWRGTGTCDKAPVIDPGGIKAAQMT